MHTPPHSLHPDLLAEITAFCDARSVSRSTFGINAIGDPRLVAGIENGRELRRKTIESIRRYMVTGVTHEQRKAGVAA